MKRMILVAAGALLLSACASTGMRDGMVYRDGSWYAPAGDGHGDYYTGAIHSQDEAYDWPWAWSVGYVPFAGYCPVRYRYCTSFWADSFFYGPGYGAYGYQPWGWREPRHRRHHDAGQPFGDPGPRPRIVREPERRDSPRERDAAPAWGQERTERGGGRMRREAKADGTK